MDNNTENTDNTTKKRFLRSGYYDTSDVDEAAKTAYDRELGGEELKKRVKRDWLFLIIGIPLFIALMYVIIMLFGGKGR
ncbi:MAG: hypothetical protein IKS90_00010 [Clostridia bacterium]|nr:hypothetical protein [Clostridia bacterium]